LSLLLLKEKENERRKKKENYPISSGQHSLVCYLYDPRTPSLDTTSTKEEEK